MTPRVLRRTTSAGRSRAARPIAWLTTALVALVAAACSTGGPNQGSAGSSTIAPGSPWLGTLAPVALPAPVNSLDAVDCVSALRCWAVGSTVGTAGAPNGAAVVATANGGTTWAVQPIPPTVGYLSDISCSDERHCTAVGQASQTPNGLGAIITTVNGGSSWVTATVPAGVLDVTAVACQADRRCLATGTTSTGSVALVASPSQPAWVQRGTLPATLTGATSVSCPDNEHCWVTAHVAVDVDHVAGQVALTTDGGSTWEDTSDPTGVGYLNGIACARRTLGRAGLPFSSTTAPSTATPAGSTAPAGPAAGSTTATTAPPPSTVPLPSTTTTTAPAGVPGAYCVAVGTTAGTVTGTRTGHGVVLTSADGGASWSSQPVVASAAALMGVSCTAVNSCVAVGSAVALEPQAGLVVLTGPVAHPWRKAAAVLSTQALTGVSCTSASRCVAVGESISEHLVGG